MSSAVGVHPLLVFVGILAGAKLAGVWGAVFGVPAVAVITAMVIFYHALIQKRRIRGMSSLAPAVGGEPEAAPSPLHLAEQPVPNAAPAGTSPLATPPGNVPASAAVGTAPRATVRR
jgi:hypothetical protein